MRRNRAPKTPEWMPSPALVTPVSPCPVADCPCNPTPDVEFEPMIPAPLLPLDWPLTPKVVGAVKRLRPVTAELLSPLTPMVPRTPMLPVPVLSLRLSTPSALGTVAGG